MATVASGLACNCGLRSINHPSTTTNNMKTPETVTSGNRAVVINQQGDSVWANLYVNVRNGIENADITLLRWTGKTVTGARRWARKQLTPPSANH